MVFKMKRVYLGVLLIFILGALVIFAIPKIKRVPPTKPQPSSSPTAEEQAKTRFLAELPITTKDFHIGYSPKYSKVVAVEIFAQDQEEFLKTKKEAATFIKNFGISNLCELQVHFIPVEKTLRQTVTPADQLPKGCPIPNSQ